MAIGYDEAYKSETRNPKQIQITKLPMTETPLFGTFGIGIWNLFRISIFGFRASRNSGA
ncbi:MAG: hypothetical protein ABR915_04430 [Thermoguttaceae bacterium]